ncbi:MAG: hypothetical protein EHM61_25365 [Acidobacteria bacterium]|nr:MAG: hypothetical protein EHM61_25365 [Acidobacteriota bacterium]
MEKAKRFVICIDNCDCPASLEVRKIYPVVDDPHAEKHGQLRVVDESGEDYLYPSACFLPIELPKPVREALFAA